MNSEVENVNNPSEGGPVVETTEVSEFSLDINQEYHDFDVAGLSENLLRGIFLLGFEKPSRVQQLGIVKVSSGKDIICQSQSGKNSNI